MTRRDQLTAAPWRKIEGILPGKAGARGRTAADHRTFVHGVMWGRRSGAHGRHLPARYGNGKSMHTRCTRWAKAGIWERIFATRMQAPKHRYLRIDSTLVRAQQQAAAGTGGVRTRRWGVPAAD